MEVGKPGIITFCSSPQRLFLFFLRSEPSSGVDEAVFEEGEDV